MLFLGDQLKRRDPVVADLRFDLFVDLLEMLLDLVGYFEEIDVLRDVFLNGLNDPKPRIAGKFRVL